MSQDKLDEVLQEALGYVTRVGDATSQLVNVTLLFGDNPNESVSGRSHRLKGEHKAWNWLNATIDYLFDENHCERAFLKDVERAQKTIADAGE